MIDSGAFQINDITFLVPPENIQVMRNPAHNYWQTLRTRSSIKLSSEFSQIDIAVTIQIVDQDDELIKLRDLVSQVRVTPFCWVQNQFIRNSVLGAGSGDQAMVLALKQLEIVDSAGSDTNVLTLNLNFSWFNYFPFTNDYLFKEDIFIPKGVRNPKKSKAWKLLYKAEQRRGSYPTDAEVGHLSTSGTSMTVHQYAMISKRKLGLFKKEIDALKETTENLEVATAAGTSELPGVEATLLASAKEALKEAGVDIKTAQLGDGTTMGENPTLDDVKSLLKDTIETKIDKNINSLGKVVGEGTEWGPTADKKGSIIEWHDRMDYSLDDIFVQKKSDGSDSQLLMQKESVFSFDDMGLIITGISISFENVLASIPMTGHTYPTYQHIGSVDAAVTISMLTPYEEGIQALSTWFSMIETQAKKFRQVPSGFRNVVLKNELVNLCGLKEFIVEEMSTATVPAQPGTYSAVLSLVDNPVEATTREAIVAGTSFTSSYEARNAVLEVLGDNLEFVQDAFSFNARAGSWSVSDELPVAGQTPTKISSNTIIGVVLLPFIGLTAAAGYVGAKAAVGSSEGNITLWMNDIVSAYKYKGPSGEEHAAFSFAARQYGVYLYYTMQRILTEHFGKLFLKTSAPDLASLLLIMTSGKEIAGSKILEEMGPFISARRSKLTATKIKTPASLSAAGMAGMGATLDPEIAQNNSEYGIKSSPKFSLVFDLWEKASRGEELTPAERDQLQKILDEDEDNRDEISTGEEIMRDFTEQVSEMADKILNSEMLDLPEFDEVRKLVASSVSSSGNNAYPDFPLSQVVDIIQEDKSYKKVKDHIEGAYDLQAMGLRNIGIAALINPDFYIYNPQVESTDKLIGHDIINAAKEAITISQGDERVRAEDSWLTDIYEATVIGSQRANQIKQDVSAGGPSRTASSNPKNDPVENRWTNWKNILLGKNETKKAVVNELKARTQSGRTAENGKKAVWYPLDQNKDLPPALVQSPVSLKQIDITKDLHLVTMNNRPARTLMSARGAEVCQHRLSLQGTLDHLPPSHYAPLEVNLPTPTLDPNAEPMWGWPTSEEGNTIISSHYGVIRQGISKSPHKGIDIVARGGKDRTTNLVVRAAANGIIEEIPKSYVSYNETWGEYKQKQGKDISNLREKIRDKQHDKAIVVRLSHSGGYQTRYVHLQWPDEPIVQELSRRFHEGKGPVYVTKGQPLGKVGNTGYSTGAHLHFEVWANANPESHLSPLDVLESEFHKSPGPVVGFDPTNESLLTKSIEQFEKKLTTEQGYSMIRAYPTFKLYFIESDEGERKKYKFDDFFAYSSVVDIEVVRAKKLPADLAILRLTNVSGVLSNRKFRGQGREGEARNAQGEVTRESLAPGAANTAFENPIASLMLQPGIPMQLRLGYNNNPDELETVMNGVITDVSFSPSDDIVEITCQSYGIELVQNVYGEAKEFDSSWLNPKLSSTTKILEEIMAAPEIAHFGRWDPTVPENKFRSLLTNRWQVQPTPADDNIFAPSGKDDLNGIYDDTVYKMYKCTAWDVIQEMTLRHPGWIAAPVPYEDYWGSRMTLFFGLPNQMYFARHPTNQENRAHDSISKFIDKAANTLAEIKDGTKSNKDISNKAKAEANGETNVVDEDLRELMATRALLQTAKDRGLIKPFRNYHVLTSTQHIIHNDIKSTSWNTFNICTIQYEDNEPDVDEDSNKLVLDDAETLTLKVDDAIPDDEKREMFVEYPNCIGEEAAKRYGQSLLKESMSYGYRGSIIIIGNAQIKPHDICYVLDEYNDMFGPIEVDQVVHKFSQQHGFITEITPCMCVHVNEVTTMASMDAMGLIAEYGLNKIGLRSLPGVSTGGKSMFMGGLAGLNPLPNPAAFLNLGYSAALSSNGASMGALATTLAKTAIVEGFRKFNFVGTFIFDKILTRTQLAHPLRFSPLVLQGKPMLGGLPTRENKGEFFQSPGKWFHRTMATGGLYLGHVYDKINPDNLFRTRGSFAAWLIGTER